MGIRGRRLSFTTRRAPGLHQDSPPVEITNGGSSKARECAAPGIGFVSLFADKHVIYVNEPTRFGSLTAPERSRSRRRWTSASLWTCGRVVRSQAEGWLFTSLTPLEQRGASRVQHLIQASDFSAGRSPRASDRRHRHVRMLKDATCCHHVLTVLRKSPAPEPRTGQATRCSTRWWLAPGDGRIVRSPCSICAAVSSRLVHVAWRRSSEHSAWWCICGRRLRARRCSRNIRIVIRIRRRHLQPHPEP